MSKSLGDLLFQFFGHAALLGPGETDPESHVAEKNRFTCREPSEVSEQTSAQRV